jgi:DNA-binding CsgD family transcriptional regulator
VATRDEPSLSERELEVVALVVEGQTNDQIARRLHLSTRTVQHHVASARRKVRARSRTHLAVLVLRTGLVPLEPPSSEGHGSK